MVVYGGWGSRRTLDQIGSRVGAKLFSTAIATKKVRLPAMLVPMGGCGRIDVHATDWVFHRRPAFLLVVMGVLMMAVRTCMGPACLVLVHRGFSYAGA
jgi:hypothetical protein